jgi:molecular chaperone GrpE
VTVDEPLPPPDADPKRADVGDADDLADPGTAAGPPVDDTVEDAPTATAEALAACHERLRRALADLANLRRRFEREVVRERSRERAAVAAQLVPVVDNLERVLQHAASDPSTLIAGVHAVHSQAVGVLDALGFPRFEDLGEPFDPERHEAVGTAEDDRTERGTIVDVAWPGYGNDETLLRPAGVVVAAGPS